MLTLGQPAIIKSLLKKGREREGWEGDNITRRKEATATDSAYEIDANCATTGRPDRRFARDETPRIHPSESVRAPASEILESRLRVLPVARADED
jgi:hypothetical protein